MFWTAIQLWLVAGLPGALMMRLWSRTPRQTGSVPADERIFWAVLLSTVWSSALVLLMASLGRYSFERLIVINAASCTVAIAFLGRRLLANSGAPRLTWGAIVPAAIVAAGLWLYFPPAEYVIGGKDPGTYINTGIQIAQRGQMVIRDPIVADVPPPFRDLFFPSHGVDTYYGIRFMGFFLQDPSTGAVVGQFPHLYPATIAIGYGLNGLSGARQAIGAWAILGLLAVYFTGARLFGRTAAGAAVVLLAINVVVIWFARYPNSELAMQTLLFAALLAAGRARAGEGAFFGVVAGALLGLTLFIRYEVMLAFAAFAGAAVLVPVSKQRLGGLFAVSFAITASLGAWYLVDPLRAYSAYPLDFLDNSGGWRLAGVALAAALGVHRMLRVEGVGRFVRKVLPIALAASIAVMACYAYFFRDAGGRLALGDAMAFRSFGWYMTPWALALAVAGAVLFVARDFWRDPPFYLTFVTFSTFFFYKTRIVPEHFWTSRRFLGMALPGAMLLLAAFVHFVVRPEHLARVAAFVTRVKPRATPSRALSVTSVVLTMALLSPTALAYWRSAEPVVRHVEYAGLIPQLEQLAARIGDNDLVIVEGRNAGTDLHVLAMPLAYIYARNVLVLESPAPDRRTFEQFVAWARGRYTNVSFLGGGGTDLLTRDIAAEPVAASRFQVPEYDSPVNAYPTGAHQKEFEFGMYRLVTGAPVPPAPIDLTIGGIDDLNVVRFHAREQRDELTYRWSGAQSFILLLGLVPDAQSLTVWMSNGGRPEAAPAAIVEVAIDDHVLGTAAPRDAVEPFTFDLPPALVGELAAAGDPVRVRLRVPAWNPRELLGVNDTRDLGVMVTRVQVQ